MTTPQATEPNPIPTKERTVTNDLLPVGTKVMIEASIVDVTDGAYWIDDAENRHGIEWRVPFDAVTPITDPAPDDVITPAVDLVAREKADWVRGNLESVFDGMRKMAVRLDSIDDRLSDVERAVEPMKPGNGQDMHYKYRLQGHDDYLRQIDHRVAALERDTPPTTAPVEGDEAVWEGVVDAYNNAWGDSHPDFESINGVQAAVAKAVELGLASPAGSIVPERLKVNDAVIEAAIGEWDAHYHKIVHAPVRQMRMTIEAAFAAVREGATDAN